MKFIALDVNQGDSFILNEGDNVFMVDGGKSKSTIVSKLIKNNITDINVVICTHYDDDHLNGIIGTLESDKFNNNIDELWLPDIFGDIASTLSSDYQLIHDILRGKVDSDIEKLKNKTLNNYTEKKEKEKNENEDKNEEIPEFDITCLEYIQRKLDCSCLLFEPDAHVLSYHKKIHQILRLIIAAKDSAARIRWLKYKDSLTKNRISKYYELYALNAYETTVKNYDSSTFFYALRLLTQINKESLVFQFKKDGLPHVLFTADSDLGFCYGNHVQLNDNSIVTAPHHGSHSNSQAYALIQGNNLVYVRSGKPVSRIPCCEYTNMPLKYCTFCGNKQKKQQVTLYYNSNKHLWIPKKSTMLCTNKCRRQP